MNRCGFGCGVEYVFLRDDDDDLYRRVCSCEMVASVCAQKNCKQHVVVARLDRSGEVQKYFCAKHGSPDEVREWTVKKEKKEEKKDEKREKKEKSSPNDVTRAGMSLYAGRCCERNILSTNFLFYCPKCGRSVSATRLDSSELDGFYLRHGPAGTSVLFTLKIEGHGEYSVQDFIISV